jgi:hypothetical protein
MTRKPGITKYYPNLKRILLIFLCVLIARGTFAQTSNNLKMIAPELLRQDFTMLRDSLEKFHAGLYRYQTKTQMDRLFDHCFTELDHPMNTVQYFNIISYLISGIKDGHTECFMAKETIDQLKAHVKWFPVQVRLIGDRTYVSCNTKEFAAGTELSTINAISVNTIRKQLFQRLSSDGSNETAKYEKVNGGHDPFFYLYYVVYGEASGFTVAYKDSTGNKRIKVLEGAELNQMECPPSEVKIDHYLQLDYLPDDIAVMTLSSFSNERLDKTKENFAGFLAASFKELKAKGIRKLIIDLRQNGGGDDTNGALLYRYLTDRSFAFYASLESTTCRFTAADHPNLAIQQPEADNYNGKVAFLIEGKSFSGAAEFSAIAKSNGRGAFIGEETGGGYYGNTSGSRLTIVLPNTNIRVNIPLKKYVMAVKKTRYKDRGVVPDHIIIPTIQEFLQNRDVQMDYAIKFIGEDQR